jgi:hypothetical protein
MVVDAFDARRMRVVVGGTGGNGDGNVKFGAREHRVAVATLGKRGQSAVFPGSHPF